MGTNTCATVCWVICTCEVRTSEVLLGELVTVVMQSTKTMIALYRTAGLQFLHVAHIHGKYGNELGYICKSWITLDEQAIRCFLDQEILLTKLITSQDMQYLHIHKSPMAPWCFDSCTHEQRMQSVF